MVKETASQLFLRSHRSTTSSPSSSSSSSSSSASANSPKTFRPQFLLNSAVVTEKPHVSCVSVVASLSNSAPWRPDVFVKLTVVCVFLNTHSWWKTRLCCGGADPLQFSQHQPATICLFPKQTDEQLNVSAQSLLSHGRGRGGREREGLGEHTSHRCKLWN